MTDYGYRAHIDGHRGFFQDAVHVILGRKIGDDRWLAITALTAETTFEEVEHGTQAPGILIPTEAARALYDALGQHYGGTSDIRQLRADYQAERGRVDRLITTLATVAEQGVGRE
jgi:hypothetical protein